MAEGRNRAAWARTATILALIANVNRDPKTPAFKPDQFDPYTPSRPAPVTDAPITVLRDVFCSGRIPEECRP